MFTLEQISNAHRQVKSGADFPNYIQALKKLGVIRYITFVEDGHTEFDGTEGFQLRSEPRYEALAISKNTDKSRFISNLKIHQDGKTNYMRFCQDCAEAGIINWVVRLEEMTCTYYGTSGDEVLVEAIPVVAGQR